MNKRTSLFFLAFGLTIIPTLSQAHFRLLSPASWIVENQLGDPQKGAPCGGTNADFGKPTNAVTDARGGSQLHIKVQETVYHPGHSQLSTRHSQLRSAGLRPRPARTLQPWTRRVRVISTSK